MRVTTTTGFRPRPGRLVEWTPVPSAEFAEHPAPPSMNQRFHLAAAKPSWLAFSFQDPRALDLDVLRAALTAWVRRHETLRSRFLERDGAVVRDVLPADGFSLRRGDVGTFTTSGQLREHLARRFAERCRPLGWPTFQFAAVLGQNGLGQTGLGQNGLGKEALGQEGTTVLGAFDHSNVDAHSLAIAAHEIQVLYRALSAGETPELPEVGSFVDHCAEPVPVPGPEDPAVHRWRSFLREGGGAVPSFPIDLGVPEGARAPQRSATAQLLGAAAADRWENTCRRDRSAFAGLLAAFGLALRRCGGPEQVRLLVPLHTRHEPRWTNAVGWFTTNAPVSFTASDGERTPLAAAEAFREALRTARTPLPSVLGALPGEFRPRRQDVFMLSYLDYRGFPVSQEFPHCAPQHISSEGECDDAQFWITRTREGLFLRARYPGTDRATAVMDCFQQHLAAALIELS